MRVPRGKAPSRAALAEGQVWTVGVRVGVCISCLTDTKSKQKKAAASFPGRLDYCSRALLHSESVCAAVLLSEEGCAAVLSEAGCAALLHRLSSMLLDSGAGGNCKWSAEYQ